MKTNVLRPRPDHKTKEEPKIKVPVGEYAKFTRVVQLTKLRLYHQKTINEIDRELNLILKVEVGLIGY